MPCSDPCHTARRCQGNEGLSGSGMGAVDSLKPGPKTGHPPRIWGLCSCDLGYPQLCGEAAAGRAVPFSALTQFPHGEPAWALLYAESPHPFSQSPGTPDLLQHLWAEPAPGGTSGLPSHSCSSIDCPHPSNCLFPSAVQLICLHPSNFIQPPNDLLEEPWGHSQPACALWPPA